MVPENWVVSTLFRKETSGPEAGSEDIIRAVLLGKVANQRAVLMRSLRDYGSDYAPVTLALMQPFSQQVE